MRIGLFTDTYFPIINGISMSVFVLAKELRLKGHEVIIFTNEHDKALPEVDVYRFKAMKPPKKALSEFRVGRVSKAKIDAVLKRRCDIIHCHTEFTMGRLGKRVAQLTQTPLVYTYHTMYEDYVHYISKHFTKLTKRLAIAWGLRYANASAMMIAPTEKVAQKFASYGYQGPLTIIPSGLDFDRFKEQSLDTQRMKAITQMWKKPFPHGLFLGRLSHEKNLIEMLEALNDSITKGFPWYLTLVGDGPARLDCEAFVHQHQLESYVSFVGMIDPSETPYYYHLADFFVSFSRSETQGLTYLEAMASNTPVIALKDTHLIPLVVSSQSGYLFETRQEFNDLMQTIQNQPTHLTTCEPQALPLLETFSAKTYATKVEAVYQTLLNNQPPLRTPLP